jgi:phospholipid-binding lipoprotein MlaA
LGDSCRGMAYKIGFDPHIQPVMTRRISSVFFVLLTVLVLAGCATRPMEGPQDINDPLEGFNRGMFRVTLAVDKAVLRPTAIVYRDVVPEPARDGVRNFLNNLNSPAIFANDLLQGNTDRALVTFYRVGINSTFGIGGLIDVADKLGYRRHSEDFGQTLAVYGVGEGAYLFVPLIGPSNPRDLFGWAVDFLFDPLTYVQWGDQWILPYARVGLDITDLRARNIETLDELEAMSLDYYASVRSLYRQSRNNEIRNGATAVEDLPDF